MTGKQLKKMLIWEGLFKIAVTAVLALTAGQIITYGVVKLLTGEMWMFTYHFTIWPVIAGLAVFTVLAWIIPLVCYKRKYN